MYLEAEDQARDRFGNQLADAHGMHIAEIAPDTRRRLAQYDWPGNVRELRNCIEHMVVVTTDTVLGTDDLPDHIVPGDSPPAQPPALVGISLAEAERQLIRNTLAMVGGNRVEAAKVLGIGERTLYRKIKEYGLR